MDTEKLAEIIKALGDPTRLRILELLPTEVKCGGQTINVSELAGRLEQPQPTISHHLKVLKHAGIVRCEKLCRDVNYRVDREALAEALDAVGKLGGLT